MTFLPIVERELRVAARKHGTFWLRVIAAVTALFIGGCFMLVALSEAIGTAQLGGPLFNTLTWLSLGLALAAGLFFTSDCLSEEKREGTLGFLFLTDLRGYDVVLGKLLATSLRCAFALIAIYPVLAITQLMGGVEPGEFWKKLLALTHALFFSLAAGMFVSAISRHSQKALSGTLLLMAGFLVAGPAVDATLAVTQQHSFRPLFSLTSPGYVFVATSGWGRTFWRGLLTSQAVAWLMLGAACWLVRRTWQEKSAKISPAVMRWRYWWKYGGGKRRSLLRRKLLAVNPVLWLAARERWQGLAVWGLAAVVSGGFAAMFVFDVERGFWIAWSFVNGAVVLVLYLWTASQAGQFFAEARRTGLIELLLAAPLHTSEIVHGPWRALVGLFAGPVTICLAVGFAAQLFSPFGGTGMMVSGVGSGSSMEWLTGLNALAGTLVTLANLVALSWFGLWMGLTSRNARLATLKTILLVQIVPWFVIAVVAVMVPLVMLPFGMVNQYANNAFTNWVPLVSMALTTGLSLAKDCFFFWWARRRLLGDFRQMATRTMANSIQN